MCDLHAGRPVEGLGLGFMKSNGVMVLVSELRVWGVKVDETQPRLFPGVSGNLTVFSLNPKPSPLGPKPSTVNSNSLTLDP